ncbi:MAG: type II secretion system minor pseudopilin GspH [Salinisphaeraceae bacterium]
MMRQRGFTLLEILVVMFIISIIVGFAVLSIDGRGGEDRLQREAERMDALLSLAADEAILFGTQMGVDFTPEGYRFLRLQQEGWVPLAGGQTPLRPRELPEGIRLRSLEADSNKDRFDPLAPGGATDESADEDDEDSEERRRPDLLLLSSGEVSPFQFELSSENVAARYLFEGKITGEIEMRRETPAGT